MIFDVPFYQLFILSVDGLFNVFFRPVFYFVVFMVYWQCKNLASQQKMLFGCENMPVWQSVLEATATGMLGGVIASMLVLLTGLSVNGLGIEYIWPLALILLIINTRFFCFAYAGGVIALSNIFLGWPEVAPEHLLALIAILHITESVLVFIGGRYSVLPVYVEFKEKAVGGFLLSNFWPLPLILTVIVVIPEGQLLEIINMPDWWPIFPIQEAPEGYTNVSIPITIAAVLGYSSISLNSSPVVKRRFSAVVLFVYSIFLLLLAYLSIGNPPCGILAAIVSVFGHELVIYFDNKRETSREPQYCHVSGQYTVLSTLYGSPARRAGLKTNDIILRLNGQQIYDEGDLLLLTDFLPEKFELEILRAGQPMILPVHLPISEKKSFGIIGMPMDGKTYLLSFTANHSLLSTWRKKYKFFKKKNRGQ